MSAIFGTRRWRAICQVVLMRDLWRCRMRRDGRVCGARAHTVNHIVRREHGGTDALSNLQAACAPCNFGERAPVAMSTPPARLSAKAANAVRLLDAAGAPCEVGRRRALPLLAALAPRARWSMGDVDACCRYRRWRGPIVRL